ncbi:PREDICTED: lactase-like protein [Chinchilla lanigera]|uniref:Cytosolic beta-glucosidase n=1 Tax=Chinchilla lanigera TaxID=34839 RepID=A0A8C2UVN0_CHILA|nr:PREDICTED: lactase-like protein [Chinchilla lanigera]
MRRLGKARSLEDQRGEVEEAGASPGPSSPLKASAGGQAAATAATRAFHAQGRRRPRWGWRTELLTSSRSATSDKPDEPGHGGGPGAMKPAQAVALWWPLVLLSGLRAAGEAAPGEASFCYGTFPPGFSWGVGSSAFQTEGAWDQDGKGPSIWDAFTHGRKRQVLGDETADSACDGYYKTQEDVLLLQELRVCHYRFSLSWPRLLPTGVRAEQVNEKGIKFYSDLIDALLRGNVTPIVTLHHWDLPQLLQGRFGGWQNASMAGYFRDYADLCFEAFGDRVKHWITFSDPRTMVEKGYETGEHAPGLQLRGTGLYQAAHHVLKAHAQAWHSYDSRWRGRQRGLVGISLNCDWGEPVDISDPRDIEAAERYLQFCLGWFADPIYVGDYPQVMKDRIGRKSREQGLDLSRLPAFSRQEKSYIKGTADFLGLGHFTTRFVTERNHSSRQGPSYQNDRDLVELVDPNWLDPVSQGLYSVPWGFRRLLHFAQTQYGNPPIYVTENGAAPKLYCAELCDAWRIQYLKEYINEMLKALKDGANVKGYTWWSLLDKFEWEKGYAERYGLYHVDFAVRSKPRYAKASAHFYKRVITANGLPGPREVQSWQQEALETCSVNNQIRAVEPLLDHMRLASEIAVPTVCALCVLTAALLLTLLLRGPR